MRPGFGGEDPGCVNLQSICDSVQVAPEARPVRGEPWIGQPVSGREPFQVFGQRPPLAGLQDYEEALSVRAGLMQRSDTPVCIGIAAQPVKLPNFMVPNLA